MKIGVVGTSWWTQRVHGPAAAAHPDWELTAVFGRSPDRVAATAEPLGCVGTTDFTELLASVDAVAFAVPPDVQADLAVRAARAGKHLLLEKPLALDVEQAALVAGAVHGAGVAAVVFFTHLWVPDSVAHLDRLAALPWDSGRFTFLASLPEAFLEASPWRAQRGALWDVGPHVLSVLERVLGHVDEVSASAGARDLVHLVLHHASGSTSSAELTLTAPESAKRSEWSFWGPSGVSSPVTTTVTQEEGVLLAAGAALTSLAEQARDGSRDDLVGASYGEHVVRVLAAAEESLGTGGRVPVPPALETASAFAL